jgi:hypothetical protein
MNSPFYKHDSYGVYIISSYITATIIRHCDDILFVHTTLLDFYFSVGLVKAVKQKHQKAFLSETNLIIPTTTTAVHNPWKPPAKEEDFVNAQSVNLFNFGENKIK